MEKETNGTEFKTLAKQCIKASHSITPCVCSCNL